MRPGQTDVQTGPKIPNGQSLREIQQVVELDVDAFGPQLTTVDVVLPDLVHVQRDRITPDPVAENILDIS